MFAPKYDVAIVDHLQPTSNQVVTDVPAALAFFGHTSTMIGEGLTRLAETAYSLPNEINFRTSGYGASLYTSQATLYEEIPEPYVKASTIEYIKNCVFYDVLDGTKSADGLLKSTNLLADIRVDHNSRFTETLIRPDGGRVPGSPEVVICPEAYDRMTSGLNSIYENWWNRFVATVSGSRRIPPELVASLLPVSYDRLMNITSSPQEILFQNAIIHSYDSSLKAFAETTGSDSQLLGMALSHAEYQQKVGAFTAGERAQQLLPTIRVIAEAIVFGIFPVIFLLAFTPLIGRILQVYITGLIWLQLWGPLLAILNLVMTIFTQHAVQPHAIDGLTITTIGGLQSGLADKLSVAAWAASTVPLVAWGIASSSFSGMVNTVGAIIGSAQSSAQHSAGSTGMGNVSTGNVTMSTITSNKTNTAVENSFGWKDTQYGGRVENGSLPAAYHYATMGTASHLDSADTGGLLTLNTAQQSREEMESARNEMLQQAQETFDQKVTQISQGLKTMSEKSSRVSSDNSVAHSAEIGDSSDSGKTAAMVQGYADRVQSTYGFSADESRDIAVRALAAKSLNLTGGVGGGLAKRFALGSDQSTTALSGQKSVPKSGLDNVGIGGRADIQFGGALEGRKEDQEKASLDTKRKEAFDSVFNSASESQARDSWSLFERAQRSDHARYGEAFSNTSEKQSSEIQSEESQEMEGIRQMASKINSFSERISQGEGKTFSIGQNQMGGLMHYISGRTGISISDLNSTIGHNAGYNFKSGNFDVRDIAVDGRTLSQWAKEESDFMDPRTNLSSGDFDRMEQTIKNQNQDATENVSNKKNKVESDAIQHRGNIESNISEGKFSISDKSGDVQQRVSGKHTEINDLIDQTEDHISGTAGMVRESGNNLGNRVKAFQNEGVSLSRTSVEAAKGLDPFKSPSDNAVSANRESVIPEKPIIRNSQKDSSVPGAHVHMATTRSSSNSLSTEGSNLPHPNFYPDSRAEAIEELGRDRNRESQEGDKHPGDFQRNIDGVYKMVEKLTSRNKKEDSPN
jgi:hypothetical protein